MTKFEENILKNPGILAIVPQCHEIYASVIHTSHGSYNSIYSSTKNMELYCLLNGSSLAGRKHSVRKQFQDVKKPSILISELNSIAAFQLPSTGYLDDKWICDVVNAVIESTPDNGSVIILSNQVKLYSPLAAYLVERRRKKALRLLHANAFIYIQSKFFTNLSQNNINPF